MSRQTLEHGAWCLGLLCAAAVWPAAALEREQFVVGWPILLETQDSFPSIPLSYEVYKQAGGLTELAVLDAEGEPMPFYRLPRQPAPATEQSLELATSPLYGSDRSLQRTEIEITSPAEDTLQFTQRARAGERIVAYLVDARSVTDAPVALALEWQRVAQPFLVTVSIEQSQDLRAWNVVGSGSVAALRIEGAELRHEEIAVAAAPGGYYRISWRGRLDAWQIDRVRLTSRGRSAQPDPELILLNAAQMTDEDSADTLYFDAGAAIPVVNAGFAFVRRNAWVDASIAYSHAPEGPWHRVVDRQLFYKLEFEGAELASEPAKFGPVEARYWRARLRREPTEALQLKLGLSRDELRFAANGVAPYMLVGGTLADAAGPDPIFATVFASLDAPVAMGAASLGALEVLGGDAALVVLQPFPWRVVLLWTVLLSAVGLLAVMASKLVKEMSRT